MINVESASAAIEKIFCETSLNHEVETGFTLCESGARDRHLISTMVFGSLKKRLLVTFTMDESPISDEMVFEALARLLLNSKSYSYSSLAAFLMTMACGDEQKFEEILGSMIGSRLLFDREPIAAALKGIELMGDEALKLVSQLEVFYWIGAICRENRTNVFSFTKMQDVLPDHVTLECSLSNSSIRRHIGKVSVFFHSYYKKFKGLELPDDDDQNAGDNDKFIARYNGISRQVIGKIGWDAWEETSKYLIGRGIKLKPIT